MIQEKNIKLVLFDLGGVLIELTDIAPMWMNKSGHYTEEQLWEMWLTNESVAQMDRGKLSIEKFCHQWITQWNLKTSLSEFKKIYADLSVGLFSESLDLVKQVKQKVSVGCLSNCNPCHWPIFQSYGITDGMEYIFVSHEIGFAKPEEEIYQHVIQTVPFPPEEILFIDDNLINVEAAKKFGMSSEKAKGINEVKQVLTKYGLKN